MEFYVTDGEDYLDEIIAFDKLVSYNFLKFPIPFDEYSERYEKLIRELLSRGEHKFFVALGKNGKFLGHVWLCMTLDTVDYVKIAYIYDIEVKQKGEGIGSALLKRAEEFAKEKGAKKVVLRVDLSNPALEWYKRKGYTERAVIVEKEI
ncbi:MULTISPECIES: GNAT family N-acetyltransferase [Thermococcus]|uniref:Putative acetyl transferase n=2 Tax=Thermococcus sibiricus TaxID=172049 RepID=C6A3D5_THESM|nr:MULTISPECIES: GNAT family N-acetyltransferase [Thermococcus]KUK29066.1 MAG: Putative acetyl transferase [Thermococcus sp. 40_45]HII68159.1 GNAT family N-acetyltransferase [Thermococcaceae archaeon]ACS90130.1 Putative acetyl transferase [Thermococcus sibiricus MM 739]KUK18687.1 MAG: Putative acetyl transferase [Thermococcus sibiricus]MBC7094970.1 GNAT family N-acetyltransferase [Thermococcus sp.]